MYLPQASLHLTPWQVLTLELYALTISCTPKVAIEILFLLLIANMRLSFSTAVFAAAASAADSVNIYKGNKKYEYKGCYNETTQIPGSAGTRALDGGINEVKQGEMTVPMCLSFCGDGDTQYLYAGLEWSRCVLPQFSPFYTMGANHRL